MRQFIVGAGTIGSQLAMRLSESGVEVTLVSRSGVGPSGSGIHKIQLDASDSAELSRIAKGCSVIYNCANPRSYATWQRDWPPIASSLLIAAKTNGADLVTLSNLYGYGPCDVPLRESTPLVATTLKGRVRARMWEEALEAHNRGDVRVLEVRPSDYFGPGVGRTAHMGTIVARIQSGKTIWAIGDPDVAHSWSFVPDVVETLFRLSTEDRAWGRAWHAPTNPPKSQWEMIELFSKSLQVNTPTIHRVTPLMLWALGGVNRSARAMREMIYQFDREFVLDSSDITDRFAIEATPLERAIAQTVATYNQA
ncbi:MAG: NAD-dependent epimerase/dehydratase family protein [Ferrimicrobium sp.]